MRIDRVIVGPLETNCWIISNDAGDVIVIDPGDDTEDVCAAVENIPAANTTVHAVILTHGHFDHVASADEVADDLGSFTYMSEAEAEFIAGEDGTGGREFGMETAVPIINFTVNDGDTISAGAIEVRVMLTPGHSPGSMSLIIHDEEVGADYVFSGDTIFAGSIGRTDFPGGDEEAMNASIEKFAALPPETKIFPGHGPATTVKAEETQNPFWP